MHVKDIMAAIGAFVYEVAVAAIGGIIASVVTEKMKKQKENDDESISEKLIKRQHMKYSV